MEIENKIEILNFTAPWCGACKMIAPIITQLVDEYASNENISFTKINVDEDEEELTKKYNIKSIPVMIFIKNGEAVDRVNGATNKKNLQDKINSLV